MLTLYRKADVYGTVTVLTFCYSETVLTTSAKEKELHCRGRSPTVGFCYFLSYNIGAKYISKTQSFSGRGKKIIVFKHRVKCDNFLVQTSFHCAWAQMRRSCS